MESDLNSIQCEKIIHWDCSTENMEKFIIADLKKLKISLECSNLPLKIDFEITQNNFYSHLIGLSAVFYDFVDEYKEICNLKDISLEISTEDYYKFVIREENLIDLIKEKYRVNLKSKKKNQHYIYNIFGNIKNVNLAKIYLENYNKNNINQVSKNFSFESQFEFSIFVKYFYLEFEIFLIHLKAKCSISTKTLNFKVCYYKRDFQDINQKFDEIIQQIENKKEEKMFRSEVNIEDESKNNVESRFCVKIELLKYLNWKNSAQFIGKKNSINFYFYDDFPSNLILNNILLNFYSKVFGNFTEEISKMIGKITNTIGHIYQCKECGIIEYDNLNYDWLKCEKISYAILENNEKSFINEEILLDYLYNNAEKEFLGIVLCGNKNDMESYYNAVKNFLEQKTLFTKIKEIYFISQKQYFIDNFVNKFNKINFDKNNNNSIQKENNNSQKNFEWKYFSIEFNKFIHFDEYSQFIIETGYNSYTDTYITLKKKKNLTYSIIIDPKENKNLGPCDIKGKSFLYENRELIQEININYWFFFFLINKYYFHKIK